MGCIKPTVKITAMLHRGAAVIEHVKHEWIAMYARNRLIANCSEEWSLLVLFQYRLASTVADVDPLDTDSGVKHGDTIK